MATEIQKRRRVKDCRGKVWVKGLSQQMTRREIIKVALTVYPSKTAPGCYVASIAGMEDFLKATSGRFDSDRAAMDAAANAVNHLDKEE